ncbi:MAG TPA: hypothetical protein VMI10_21240 [Terriglobales bacterium]|nr:hypothetical protein [Terriglobales bacterium]
MTTKFQWRNLAAFFDRRRKLLSMTFIFIDLVISSLTCAAASKPHVIALGKTISAKWLSTTGQKAFDLKVRPLLVDGRLKEYVTGTPHEITDRLFVVRRAFRANDALPSENGPRWQWQRGGWLMVDRLTGHISQLTLPEFDVFVSASSWYRDYVAYCGVTEDGKKLFAMVMQIGRRKAILKNEMGEAEAAAEPDSGCATPVWQRSPTRVTFQTGDNRKLVFSLHSRVVDLVEDNEDEEP